ENQWHEVRLVVNQVELVRVLVEMGDVERFPDFGVDIAILGIAARNDSLQLACGFRIESGEKRHVDSTRYQRFGEQAGDEFPRAIVARRGAPGNRAEHGNTHVRLEASRSRLRSRAAKHRLSPAE